jgi:capsular exopolysaccharide synthesis family protein
MEIDKHIHLFNNTSDSESTLKDLLDKYIGYWKWFLFGITVSLCFAFLYLRYQVPLYEVNASILIKDEKKGGALSELSAFEDLGILKGNSNIDNEIEVLKSRSLMTLVAKELNLNVQYFIVQSPIDEEKFDSSPVLLVFEDGISASDNLKTDFTLSFNSNTTFNLFNKRDLGLHKLDETVSTEYGKIKIIPNPKVLYDLSGKEVKIVINPLLVIVDRFREAISISPVNAKSNVIAISLKDAVKERAEAIVNNLIKQHNTDAITDKNEVSKNTAAFINDRIQFITRELSEVEGDAEQFKTEHKLVDVESEAKVFLQNSSVSELEIVENNTQIKLADYMLDYTYKHANAGELIPTNLGLNDAAVSEIINNYNRLALDRNRILKNSSDKNPVIQNMDSQLLGLRNSLNESLINFKNSLQIKLQELNKQENGINSRIASVPKYEREYRVIQRQQQIKEALYLYLLQKREETNIALAVTIANAKVIDNAYSDGKTVAPKRKVVYLIFALFGVLLPLIILYVVEMLDNKVHGKSDIDKLHLPFLGDIPLTDSKNKVVVSKGDSSSIAEAFRLLRTNVDFMLGAAKNKGRTIFVTSTIAKEGKSFVALNLAASMSISGKRVLLIGMDLRAPKILKYLGIRDKEGITNFISDSTKNIEDFIFQAPGSDSLFLLPAGSIPPNPAELLMNVRVKEMFDSVKEMFDYVIVDTAPVGMVTDTLLLSEYADVFVYVVRANYLDKRMLSIAENVYKEKRLKNVAVLINGSDYKKGYGYGYGGYGYGNEKADRSNKRNK